MEQAANQFISELEKTSRDLDYIHSKLSSEFTGRPLNPVVILQTLERFQAQVEALKAEHANIAELKQNIEKSLGEKSARNKALLDKICSQTGQPRIALESAGPVGHHTTSNDDDGETSTIVEDNLADRFEEEMEERTLSRKTGKAFLPFSQAELESLSPQARGRLTLDQVNTEYRLLWEYFVRKNPRSESALASAIVGLKPGKFGENLLRCLRALGVLTVDSRNNVVWLRK